MKKIFIKNISNINYFYKLFLYHLPKMFFVAYAALKSSAGCLKYEMTFLPQPNYATKYPLKFTSSLDPGI